MPIFVYESVHDAQGDGQSSETHDCCHFEVLQWSSEAPLLVCPQCGGPVRRALTEFATQSCSASTPSRSDSREQPSAAAGAARQPSPSLISAEANSSASRAARLAYRHVCGKNCRH